jgi:hypothetical protein
MEGCLLMKDIIVKVRGGQSFRLHPGGYFEFEISTHGSEINQGGVSKKAYGFKETHTLTYDELIPYIGTTSGIFRVRYANA